MALRKSRQLTEVAPTRVHPGKTLCLSAAQAQPLVAKYIQRSANHPHYHPDSILGADGVHYAPKSGKNGGIVLHYLKRVEAGLRGEHLAAETKEELQVKFGDEQIANFGNVNQGSGVSEARTTELPEGDDARLDEAIAAKSRSEKKALKRKRDADGGANGAEASSQAHAPGSSPPAFGAQNLQSKDEFEHDQDELVGEVGDRQGAPEGAPVSKQNGQRPAIVKHNSSGRVAVPQQNGNAMSRAERKAAKRLRVKEEQVTRQEARKAGGGDRATEDASTKEAPVADAPEPAAKKRRVKQEKASSPIKVEESEKPPVDEDAARAAKKLKKQQKKERRASRKEGKTKTEESES